MNKHILFAYLDFCCKITTLKISKQRIGVGYGDIIDHFGSTNPYKKDVI